MEFAELKSVISISVVNFTFSHRFMYTEGKILYFVHHSGTREPIRIYARSICKKCMISSLASEKKMAEYGIQEYYYSGIFMDDCNRFSTEINDVDATHR